jgi:hypothetical protein
MVLLKPVGITFVALSPSDSQLIIPNYKNRGSLPSNSHIRDNYSTYFINIYAYLFGTIRADY